MPAVWLWTHGCPPLEAGGGKGALSAACGGPGRQKPPSLSGPSITNRDPLRCPWLSLPQEGLEAGRLLGHPPALRDRQPLAHLYSEFVGLETKSQKHLLQGPQNWVVLGGWGSGEGPPEIFGNLGQVGGLVDLGDTPPS